MAGRTQTLSLFKTMMREGGKFSDFNFRNYALRRVRDGFKSGKRLTDESAIAKELEFAKTNLDVIKRQTALGQLYGLHEKLTIEVPKKTSN